MPSSSLSFGKSYKFDILDKKIEAESKYMVPEQLYYNEGKLSDFDSEKEKEDTSNKTDVKVPESGLFLYQMVPYKLDYYEVCHELLSELVLIYNRLFNNDTANFNKIDK
mmetsp:Transcript_17826/g.17544  ORF Transcript_17826/g.17544 Transcript_17826/m.17544 type:complete len:109 (-) Transcript_17826:120-446(-)